MKIVRAIRQGRIIPNKPKTITSKFEPYAIWSETTSTHQPPLPAPKPRLPTTAESYNPPEEYLPTEEERREWEALDPEDRERNFLPQKYNSLRLVPAFDQFIQQRFDRQLDLYLAPRIQRVKLNINPDSLIPKLPSPSSLKPFPNYRSLDLCHSNRAKALSVSPDGAWVVSGDEDGVVSLWEVIVGREVKRWKFGGKVASISWCPRTDAHFFAVGLYVLILFQLRLSSHEFKGRESHLHRSFTSVGYCFGDYYGYFGPCRTSSTARDAISSQMGHFEGRRLRRPYTHSATPDLRRVRIPPRLAQRGQLPCQRLFVTFLLSVQTHSSHHTGSQGGVWIHQLTKRHSQAPFKKIKGAIQTVAFHPQKPHFFVAVRLIPLSLSFTCDETYVLIRLNNMCESTISPNKNWSGHCSLGLNGSQAWTSTHREITSSSAVTTGNSVGLIWN